jgi:hypothetical protein
VEVLVVGATLPPAATPPVGSAIAGPAQTASAVKLPESKLSARNRKTTTSFVGLRG